ncbi:MAG: SDR family oxidoreductase [Pseudomonadales bacterium]|nr:SDR family oxidoreductase [Pseudomonadales bacterium]
MQIAGKTILLTGASGGIGSQIAHRLARAGARLILVGRQESVLQALAAELDSTPLGHMALSADVASAEGREQISLFCGNLVHGPDILINAAGLGSFDLLADENPEKVEALFQVNVIAPILLSQALLPGLCSKQEAAIVNIGSVFGFIGYPGFSLYGSSKFALRGFSEALQRELATSRVRVLHLAPRATDTAINDTRVQGFNHALGNAVDKPEQVAEQLYQCLVNERWGHRVIGWPERFYVVLNALLPGMVGKAIVGTLHKVVQFSRNGGLFNKAG